MINNDNGAYFEQRAEEALDRAQNATHPAAARAHYALAELYLERMLDCRALAYGDESPPLFRHWDASPM